MWTTAVARMERSAIRDSFRYGWAAPDFAALHPGYGFVFNCHTEIGPCSLLGAGVRPSSFSLSFPRSRGMARRKAHVPDFAGTARITPGDPEAPGLTHQRRMRPRLSTRHRGICPLSRFSVTGLMRDP